VFFVTEIIVNLKVILINQVFPVCGLYLEEENTTTLQNLHQIFYYIYIYIYIYNLTGLQRYFFRFPKHYSIRYGTS